MDTQTQIIDLRPDDTARIEQLALMAYAAFQEHAPNWLPTIEAAKAEVLESLEPKKISRLLIDTAEYPLGWIGAIPQSGGRIWEIHPLAIAPTAQHKGYGRQLIDDLEVLAKAQGALTLMAGTSDVTGATTLSEVDLYQAPAAAIATFKCLKPHPVAFYQKNGFKIVGIMPDADGPGKPGITLAKRVK